MMYRAFSSLSPSLPASFTTVTMATSSKTMYNPIPAPSVNYGYANTIAPETQKIIVQRASIETAF